MGPLKEGGRGETGRREEREEQPLAQQPVHEEIQGKKKPDFGEIDIAKK